MSIPGKQIVSRRGLTHSVADGMMVLPLRNPHTVWPCGPEEQPNDGSRQTDLLERRRGIRAVRALLLRDRRPGRDDLGHPARHRPLAWWQAGCPHLRDSGAHDRGALADLR